MTTDDRDLLDQDAPNEASDDLADAKLRRAQRAAAIGEGAAPPAGERGEVAAVDAGPKLTTRQRKILIGAIAQYYEISAVREYLTAEFPDFPSISDNLIRYYRRKVDEDAYKELADVRAQAPRQGLARYEVRVAHLRRHVARLDKQIELAVNIPGNTLVPALSREYISAMKALREEVEPLFAARPALPAPRDGDPLGDDERTPTSVVGDDVIGLVTEIMQQRGETRLALAGAQRPAQAQE